MFRCALFNPGIAYPTGNASDENRPERKTAYAVLDIFTL
jgi:hypothetical protein